jgi:alanyl-tRNA synthetase
VRNTAEIGLFKVLSESGIAAGVRRIEAISGTRAYEWTREQERTLRTVAELIKATPATVVKRIQALTDERRALERRLDDMMRGGAGGGVKMLLDSATSVDGVRLIVQRTDVPDAKSVQALAEAVCQQAADSVVVLAASFDDGKNALVVAAGDAARERGARADTIVKSLSAQVGGRGGGKPQLAQAGIPDSAAIATVLSNAAEVVAAQLAER